MRDDRHADLGVEAQHAGLVEVRVGVRGRFPPVPRAGAADDTPVRRRDVRDLRVLGRDRRPQTRVDRGGREFLYVGNPAQAMYEKHGYRYYDLTSSGGSAVRRG
ncbi:hypothetical protein [Winogradskya consettensis]|uniref:hypothetical protein n=1 Tax=Winogradskya consettensis TaxID=113560 RepID=UPI001BB45145|nr:hypothetical protein [Actinoplanes consettensis]